MNERPDPAAGAGRSLGLETGAYCGGGGVITGPACGAGGGFTVWVEAGGAVIGVRSALIIFGAVAEALDPFSSADRAAA